MTMKALSSFLLFNIVGTSIQALLHDYISTDVSCYEPGEDIVVTFSTAMPTMQNWVGLYEAETAGRDPVQSMWSCGSHDEMCEKNALTFRELPPGNYISYLRGVGYHGRTIDIASEPFIIKANGQSCEDAVSTDRKQYAAGEEVLVFFERLYPDESDAVALYEAESDFSNLEKPFLWLWTCGNQDCRDNIDRGVLTFGTFSLATGHYKAALGQLRPDGKFVAFEKSETFSIVAERECKTVISLSRPCFKKGEDFLVEFENCSPKSSDKVAIYPATADLENLGIPVAWIFSCGDKSCVDPSNASSQDDFGDISDSWPIDVGEYKAVLVRKNPGGRSQHHASEPFRIVGRDRTCESPDPGLRASVSSN